ncbi:MAG: NUDIX hydrolase [Myxococcota bacterium]
MTTAPLLRPASTVLLLREESQGFSVFMVQRNRRLAFMPRAWVFPGGRVDAADALREHPRVVGGELALTAMGLPPDEGVAFLVAAARETLEESGVWLGSGEPSAALRDALNARECTLAEGLDAEDLRLDLDVLRPWSWWVTPEAEPRRYDTRFFVAVVTGQAGRHDDGETVNSAWMPIGEAVRAAEAGELPMAPPTWWTLRELNAHSTADRALKARRSRRPICPILRGEMSDLTLVLPGHDEHSEPPIEGLPTEVRFSQGRWWAAPTSD